MFAGTWLSFRGGVRTPPSGQPLRGAPGSERRRRYVWWVQAPVMGVFGGIGAAIAGAPLAGALLSGAIGLVVALVIAVVVTLRR